MKNKDHQFTNELIHESSPYLLQHAHNPVDWYPWGEAAFEKAKQENKLVIISIGYAACHWCHVMEHECFENERVAKYMNDNFVSIKIDREERPDIDQIYMNAVQLLTGRGGWPLNCITLPDGRPLYGGTYFPEEQWLNMLGQVLTFVKDNPDKAEQQAASLTQGVRASEMVYASESKAEFSLDDLHTIFKTWRDDIDYTLGGHKRAPKFPLPVGYQFLLHFNYLAPTADALKAVATTLNKMADGGIYDQVGGGFARYSVDEFWHVPHFEKMLYDNAQLVSLYSAAYQQSQNPYYKLIVTETLDFIQREMTSREGGFFSSLDADSEGEEGKFYVWTKKEIEALLGAKADLIIDYYSVTEEGNWEHGNNILLKSVSDQEIADKYKLTTQELAKRVLEAKKKMLAERGKRIRPGLDDKVLTSWSALMITGYVDAYRALGDSKYLTIARENAEFINAKIKTQDNRLYRNYKNGKATINAFLDDYAFTIEAFLSLYEATFDYKWLEVAQQLATYAIDHFYDSTSGMFFYTSDIDPALIARKFEVTDNVIPSANSQMAKNLFVLGHYFYNEDYIEKAKQMLNNVKQNALQGGAYYANWDVLMAWFAKDPYEVAIVGDKFDEVRREIDKQYLPQLFLSGGKTEGSLRMLESKLIKDQTTIYVCQNKICKKPTADVKEALGQIGK